MKNRTSFFLFTFAVLMLCLSALPSIALAQSSSGGEVTDDEVNTVAKDLYCPVCENIPLDVCPTKACADWRDEIRLKLNEGWTKDQIKQYFVDRFGDRVLGAPPARGINWLVYILPPVLILVGVYVLYRAFQSWRQIPPLQAEESTASPTQAPQSQDEYMKKLEEQLKASDR